MWTQIATQMEVAAQTVQYSSEGSTLLLGLVVLLGVSAGMIIVTALYEQFAPIYRGAMEIRRLYYVQEHGA